MKALFYLFLCHLALNLAGQDDWDMKFEQLETMIPTPNSYRTAAGKPGEDYWQPRVDYSMLISLDDDNQTISGKQTITYHNRSPYALEYLWVQLDQNVRAPDTETSLIRQSTMADTLNAHRLFPFVDDFFGGFDIEYVRDGQDNPLEHTTRKTMMRIDPPKPLESGSTMEIRMGWSYNINDRMESGGRSGMEYFPKDGNYSYTIAQFYPRMAHFSDNEGWQNKQFLGQGEFTLSFGHYHVEITVPSDFVVAATGELENPENVLAEPQMERLKLARSEFENPVLIVTEQEAIENEKSRSESTKTWKYNASMVRDFAFAASRKYIWDAMAVNINGKTPLAMSYYPKEGNPLWEEYSTRVVAQSLITYSRHTIDYPYPVAISVHAASIGMEYPMICFNYGRPDEDGSYSERLKSGMIGVIVHEVGHNFFPMIINSDERQWTWMDEGLNTFVQHITQLDFDPDFRGRRGSPEDIVPYMKGDGGLMRPIMTNSEQILQFGNNAYGKPASALTILRETVLGPELFDFAFKTYSERWAFKHPTPADFFRTMEDASSMDLDWFWRGWFYSTDNVDVSVDKVTWYSMEKENLAGPETQNVKTRKRNIKGKGQAAAPDFGLEEPKTFAFKMDTKPGHREFMNDLNDSEVKEGLKDIYFYQVTLSNVGGLVTPLILKWNFEDNTSQTDFIPAEIWRLNEKTITKVFAKQKRVVSLEFDPEKRLADTDKSNNFYPPKEGTSRFEQFLTEKGK